MGLYLTDKTYSHPGIECPKKAFVCINCPTPSGFLQGVWNNYAGKWFYGFTCHRCGTYQSMFWVDPRVAKIRRESAVKQKQAELEIVENPME